MNKTNRHRGEAREAVHRIALTRVAFTQHDLPTSSSLESWSHTLRSLARLGKLRVVRKGVVGLGGNPPVYKLGNWKD